MFTTIWHKIGNITYWLLWPLLFVYLRWSHRTRVLLMYRDEVLVVKGWLADGKWQLPGGGLKHKEAMLTGAIREVKEETNILLKPSDLIHLGTATARSHGLVFSYEQFGVVLDNKPPIKKQKGEITSIRWVKSSLLNNHTANPVVSDMLSAWKRYAQSDTM